MDTWDLRPAGAQVGDQRRVGLTNMCTMCTAVQSCIDVQRFGTAFHAKHGPLVEEVRLAVSSVFPQLVLASKAGGLGLATRNKTMAKLYNSSPLYSVLPSSLTRR